MAEAAPGQLRHRDAAGGDQRRQRQRDLVADAAGGVLVGRRARQRRRSPSAPPTRSSRAVQRAISRRSMPLSRIAIASADICSSATSPRGVGVDHPVDLAVGQRAAVALGDDHLDRVVAASSSSVGSSTRSRSSGPNASGSTSVIGRSPTTRQQQQLGAAVLLQQLAAAAARHDHLAVAVDAHEVRQPPAAGRRAAATPAPHSAHSVTPYAAFSTLQPTTSRPSSTSAAAPTGKWL